MGGKAINNIGGTLSDFFFKCGTRNVSIIEIRKPTTKLIDGKYRNEVFSPSEELSSAIVQLRKQKDVLLKEYYIKKANSENLKENELESFELFRNGLKDIEIITFNEIVDKLVLISENLSH